MKVIYKHAEKFLNAVDKFEKDYVGVDGKMVRSKEAIESLDTLLKKGLKFYNDVINEKVYEKFPMLSVILNKIKEYTDKLKNNEQTAKKLTMENALVIWQQLEVALALLASYVMDFLHTEGN